MFNSRATPAMPAPRSVPQNAVPPEDRRPKLGDSAISAVGEDAPVALAELLDVRSTVVDGVVAISGAAAADREDTKISAAHQHLDVARPAIVLRLRCRLVIACRHERALNDPGLASIDESRREECRHSRNERRDNAMRLRFRDPEERAQLTNSEIRSERPGDEPHAIPERQCPRSSVATAFAQP